jgi:hypothetical protein
MHPNFDSGAFLLQVSKGEIGEIRPSINRVAFFFSSQRIYAKQFNP